MYEEAGFKRMAEFEGWPEGHINVVLCKTLSLPREMISIVARMFERAVKCGIAIQAWSEGFRRRPPPAAAIRLGRTRIGIETGPAVVGDVGIRSKLDYTAHGDAVNMAARLEACNKELGSTICIGPGAAARCDAPLLRTLGLLAVRGREEPIAVFEPWPDDAPPAWREAYLKAYALLDCDAAQAATLLKKLMAECPADLAMRRLAERLPGLTTAAT